MAETTTNQDTILGGLQGDLIIGGQDNDSLTGEDGNDLMFGLYGDDTLSGAGGQDVMFGGRGNDEMFGGDDVDMMFGGQGNDVIDGQKGDDFMFGGQGDDRLIWNNGDGSDDLFGGQGYDVSVVNDDAVNGDDFVLGQNGDKALFERVNLGLFNLDAKNVEKFEVNATGGDDKLTVNDLSNTTVESVYFSGGEGNDTLDGSNTSTVLEAYGGAGDDELIGGSANDTLIGDAGNDDIEGEKGDDTMIGGEGDDTLGWDDGDGSDLMSGGAGYDTIDVDGAVEKGDEFVLNQDGEKAIFDRTNLGPFTLTTDTAEKFEVDGLGGDDKFDVNDLSNTAVESIAFDGGEGNDTLDGADTSTVLEASGGVGDDLLQGGAAADILNGDEGNDTLLGGEGIDTLNGGEGNDIIDGQKGDDIMNGDAGDDTLIWNNGDGSDDIDGGEGYDVALVNDDAVNGDDFVLSANGEQAFFERVNLGLFNLDIDNAEEVKVNATGGDDKFTVNDLSGTDVELVSFAGGEGNDYLDGSNTNTPIFATGDAGNDTLIGGNGDDTLIGGAGSDLIIGNDGNDILIGGEAADIFNLQAAFDAVGTAMNTIQDFVSGTDKIMLDVSAFQARSGEPFNIANEFAVVMNDDEANASSASLIYNMGTGGLIFNQNGAEGGYGEGGQFAMLEGGSNLTADDFLTSNQA